MAMAEKVRILLVKRKITVTDLAKRLGMSQSNLSNKLSRDNFSEKELQEIAEALNCDLDIRFTLRDTGEQV
ncbi:helix-turn-helix domain-containing protein [Blautia wexlerae]|jgi:transcriptional regulator with XRE-family HTH domain|uniref:helix-turn-helix domain-containing protein n=1 Tax=Blautia wexlerae TaxID=418240 RepID=UPI00189DCCBA|nr:helix-turn-helix transcriptional regulator [Blautia wexlerae]